MKRTTQCHKSNVQCAIQEQNNGKPTTKGKTNKRRTLQDKKIIHEMK
jgi:hypothetical protein